MRFEILLIVAAAAMASAGMAEADGPFYVSGSLGGYFRQSDVIDTNFFHLATPDQTVPGINARSFDPGFVADLAVGYNIASHIRLEAELGYATYTGGTLHPFTTQPGFPAYNGQPFKHLSGDQYSRVTGTVNGFYDFSSIAGMSPYVGAGVGQSQNRQSQGLSEAADGTTLSNRHGTAMHGLALFEAGVSIPLMHNLYLAPAYRYVHYFVGGQDVAHVVKVGLRYAF